MGFLIPSNYRSSRGNESLIKSKNVCPVRNVRLIESRNQRLLPTNFVIGVGLRTRIGFSPLMQIIRWCAIMAVFILTGWGAEQHVRINEVMYHPAEDRDQLQYVE